MSLHFKQDYANAILDDIHKRLMKLAECNVDSGHMRIMLGRLERRVLEDWLLERGCVSTVMDLPGFGPTRPNSQAKIFGVKTSFQNCDTLIRVVKAG